jgi:hypothetical protein
VTRRRGVRGPGSGFSGGGTAHARSSGAGTLRTLKNARAMGVGQVSARVRRRMSGVVGFWRNLPRRSPGTQSKSERESRRAEASSAYTAGPPYSTNSPPSEITPTSVRQGRLALHCGEGATISEVTARTHVGRQAWADVRIRPIVLRPAALRVVVSHPEAYAAGRRHSAWPTSQTCLPSAHTRRF